MLAAFPVLGRRLLPVKGRVEAVYQKAGQGGETGVYAVDVQPLDAAGQPVGPILPHLTIPTIWVGPSRGILAIPPVGSLVRVGWYESGEPYLDAILPDGMTLPKQDAGGLTIVHPSARIEILPTGDINIESAEGISLNAPLTIIMGDLVVTGQINP